MSAAVLNNQFLTRLLTSGEKDFEHVSLLKEDTSSSACELTSNNVDFVLISYIQWPATLANTFVFILQGSALAYLRCNGRF